jgi:hypothetical protein
VCRHQALTLLCVLVEFRHNGLLTNACTTLEWQCKSRPT